MVDTLLIIGISPANWVQEARFLHSHVAPEKIEKISKKLAELDILQRATLQVGTQITPNGLTPKELHRHPYHSNFIEAALFPNIGEISVGAPALTLIPYLEKYHVTWALADQVIVDSSLPMTRNYLLQVLDKYRPKTVGISTSLLAEKDEHRHLISCVKEWQPEVPVILGGCGLAVLYPKATLADLQGLDVEVICYGDGEEIYPQVVRALLNREELHKIPNIAYKTNHGYRYTESDDLVMDVNDLLTTPSTYFSSKAKVGFIQSMRGCPYRCKFCNHPKLSPKLRAKSAERLYLEFATAYQSGVEGIIFGDSMFTYPLDRLRQLCELLIENKIRIHWIGQARAEHIDAEIASLMSKAGCTLVSLGIETIHEKTMKSIGKHGDLSVVKRAIAALKSSDIMAGGTFIIGLPGDEQDIHLKILDFIGETGLDMVHAYTLRIEPGTPFYENPETYGLALSKSEELAKSYWSHPTMDLHDALWMTYEFYHKLIHDEIAATFDIGAMFRMVPNLPGIPTGDMRELSRIGIKIKKHLWQGLTSNQGAAPHVHSLLKSDMVEKYFHLTGQF